MNLPNLITILRILMVPVFAILLLYDHTIWALLVFALAGLTDCLDGFIARSSNQKTELGSYLDPVADKLLLITGFVGLSFLHRIPVWSTIIVVSRDLILLFGTMILYMNQGHLEIRPTWLGKFTTLLQGLYLLLVLFSLEAVKETVLLPYLLAFTMAVTVLSGLHYIHRGIRFFNGNG